MKFGKYLEGRQLELPEYNGHFIDYKGLKKLIKQLAFPVIPNNDNNNNDDLLISNQDNSNTDEEVDKVDFNNPVLYRRLQENKASFFFKLERELEKVNAFYLQKESDLRMKFNILQTKYKNYKKSGKLNSRVAISFKTIYGGFIKFQKDLSNFEQYVELNKTGFSKVLKKWDKRSHSQEKEFYLATVVSVQPIFSRNEALRLNDETLNILIELNDVNNNNTEIIDASRHDSKNNINTNNTNSISDEDNHYNNIIPKFSENTRLSESLNILNIEPFEFSNQVNSGQYFDNDTEIENWYIELLNIAKLKDDDRRKTALSSFTTTKIQLFIDKNITNPTVDKTIILKECLSKLFLLLIGSTIDDQSLQIFYETSNDSIDLLYYSEDEELFTKRNILHEAMHCPTQHRNFIVQVILDAQPIDILKKLINDRDIYLRTPLHYAAELGKVDSVRLLLHSNLVDTVDGIDNNSKTPLILSIIYNNMDITRELLIDGFASVVPKLTEQSGPQFSPLGTACRYNNYEAAKLILELRGQKGIKLDDPSDPESLDSLHIVAKTGGDGKMIKLLIDYGADPNRIDNFNKWTPIFYAIQKGNADTVKILLNNGASLDISDQDNKNPLFYTLWESHIGVLNAILPYINKLDEPKLIQQAKLSPMSREHTVIDLDGFSDSLEHIPDFELPPPIIPLTKYGHNFLEKKIFIKLTLEKGAKSIKFNQDDELELTKPGRMTITSNISDIVPRNIVFPADQEADYDESSGDDHEVVFLIDTLNNLSIDFEIFASFGTRLLAKTSAMSHFFSADLVSSLQDITLPLFDDRLNCVGKLNLKYQVILPYIGKPLQITKYEPYWKSTGNNNNPSIIGLDPQNGVNSGGLNIPESTFVTSSSLDGVFISLKVFSLNDGTIVVSPNFYIEVENTTILINDLNKNQLEKLCGYKIDEIDVDDSMNDTLVDNVDEKIILFFKKLISSKIFEFESLLKTLPKSIQLIIQVCFPTTTEIEKIPIKISPYVTINGFVDNILHIIFEHERTLRHSGKSIRSIVFSSCNWQACSILNWKQPNFPVLLRMNTLTKSDGIFISDTPHRLKSLVVEEARIDIPPYEGNLGTSKDVLINSDIHHDAITNTNNNIVETQENKNIKEDNGPILIHEMVRFAINNNLLGVIIPYELLALCDTLSSTIKGQELLLIGSSHDNNELMKQDKELNGRYYDSELIFD